ncbi:universal stress protein [Haloplanus pelagicus]|jgi:nucleotide-binding universal stress UspA family protein|uniref:universal stress protein n=1 Tax=Haloplanus pelagicus TaxID=2949995 RepID=UPI00203F78D2|nr:universal stress protein [Haloplanus sp. HW8-1]
MRTYVLGTDTVDTSAALCDYLDGRLDAADTVHAVNSLRGGSRTDAETVRDGEDALNVVQSRLGALASVETHQLVRGNAPDEDLLAYAVDVDADELVVGVRKRNPTGKALFGSTTQSVLLESSRPVAVVPLDAE